MSRSFILGGEGITTTSCAEPQIKGLRGLIFGWVKIDVFECLAQQNIIGGSRQTVYCGGNSLFCRASPPFACNVRFD